MHLLLVLAAATAVPGRATAAFSCPITGTVTASGSATSINAPCSITSTGMLVIPLNHLVLNNSIVSNTGTLRITESAMQWQNGARDASFGTLNFYHAMLHNVGPSGRIEVFGTLQNVFLLNEVRNEAGGRIIVSGAKAHLWNVESALVTNTGSGSEILVENGGRITNSIPTASGNTSFLNRAGAVLRITGAGTEFKNIKGATAVVNSPFVGNDGGLIEVLNGARFTNEQATVMNENGGELRISGAGSRFANVSGAQVLAESGALLRVEGAGTFENDAFLGVRGATLLVAGENSALLNDDYRYDLRTGGETVVDERASVVIRDQGTLHNRGLFSNAGALRVTAGGRLVSEVGTAAFSAYLNTGVATVSGAESLFDARLGSLDNSGVLRVADAARVNSALAFDNHAGGIVEVAARGQFVNSGLNFEFRNEAGAQFVNDEGLFLNVDQARFTNLGGSSLHNKAGGVLDNASLVTNAANALVVNDADARIVTSGDYEHAGLTRNAGSFENVGRLHNGGVFETSGAYFGTGTFDNDGTLRVTAGGEVDIQASPQFAEGVLDGGTWEIIGSGIARA